jgi:beta-lactamase superfamily II metal-dependent hydrolase
MSKTKENKKNLIVRIFDVGHGDSILIEFPDGKDGKHLGIIDCNSHASSNRIAESNNQDRSVPKILSYLTNNLNDKKKELDYIVDFICLSHYHIDHYNGIGCLIKGLQKYNIPIKEFWDPGISRKKYEALREMVEKKRSREKHGNATQLSNIVDVLDRISIDNKLEFKPLVKIEQNIKTISDVRIDIIAPYGNHWYDYSKYLVTSDRDDSTMEHLVCSAMMLTYGQGRIILGADLCNEAWNIIMDKFVGESLRSNVVKVSHHGSCEGNFPEKSLWDKIAFVDKTVATISGGYRKDISLKCTIQELGKYSVLTYCTGNHDDIQYEEPSSMKNKSQVIKHSYRDESKLTIKKAGSYHGDISIYMDCNGNVTVEPEFDNPVISTKV